MLSGCTKAVSAWRETLNFHCASFPWLVAFGAQDNISTRDWEQARSFGASQAMQASGCALSINELFSTGPLETAVLAFWASGKVHERDILQFGYAIVDRMDPTELARWRDAQARELFKLAENEKRLKKTIAKVAKVSSATGLVDFATFFAYALAQDNETREREIKASSLGLFFLADPKRAIASLVAAGSGASPQSGTELTVKICAEFHDALTSVDPYRARILSVEAEGAAISSSAHAPGTQTAAPRLRRL